MSSLSTASKDSHEFVLLPSEPAATTLVQVSTSVDHSTPLPPATPRPPSPRKLVKRSLPVEDGPISHSPPLAPSSPPIGHSRRGSAGSPRSSSSRERSPPIIAPHESLVGDVQMSRTRVIISKTHTAYDPVGVPFRSALVGFRATFHSPPATSARVRDAEITLRFMSSQDNSHPIIKAITPTSMGVGPTTSVENSYSTTAGLHIGYDPAGTLELTRTASTTYTHSTQARISSSGVETNELWLTLREDPTSRQGIPSLVDFAVLVQMNSGAFEAELSCSATIGRGPQALLKLLSSPQEWIALYDGTTSLNPLRLSPESASSPVLRPTGLVTASEVEMTDGDGSDLEAMEARRLRGVANAKKKRN
ncbi:hypothetical protein JCM5353_006768 [Sporobolomyces roseus]